jgi:lycopene cyclase CruA
MNRASFERIVGCMSVLGDSGRLRDFLGTEWAAQVTALEDRFAAARTPSPAPVLRAPDRGTALDKDILLAGGGLSLLYAVALAQEGFRVAVVDPRGVGRGHREWNASTEELQALAAVVARPEELIVARYARGIVRFAGGREHSVRGVLDAAVDAQGLLDRLRARALALGVQLIEGEAVGALASGPGGVAAQVGSGQVTARLVLDGRGAASPLASWDLVCPTVGGVLAGLEHDPEVGEILVTVDGARGGVQPIWESFPGRRGELTTYLFEYREPRTLPERPLTALYAQFIESLPRYKRGSPRLVKPAFGFIPACSRLRPRPTAPMDRVLLVGDAAGRHSPLTFCGFGSALRSFAPVSSRIARLLSDDRLDRKLLASCWTEPGSLAIHGALALMMIDRGGLGTARDPQAINRLLEAAFGALAAQGEPAMRAFLQDSAQPRSVVRMLRGTARAVPQVYAAALRNLRPAELAALLGRFASFAAGASA